jgi:hypothetical protein
MRHAFVILAAAAFGVAIIGSASPSIAADDAKAPATNPTTTSSPSKFYGTISAVDEKAKTFTIEGQTYTIVTASELTKAADGSAATIADAKVGETARGTYTTSSDGTMKVTKVRFGKKTGSSSGGGKSGGKKSESATTQPAGA